MAKKKVARKPVKCKCLEQVNQALAESNTQLVTRQSINFATGQVEPPCVTIATEKIESKKRQGPVVVVATYCPFCGKKGS